MYYETFDISDPQNPALLEQVEYTYGGISAAVGNPTLIARKLPNDRVCSNNTGFY